MRDKLKNELYDRLEKEHEEYKSKWLKMTPQELIDNCLEVSTVTRLAQDLPTNLTDREVAFLLGFSSPLRVMSEECIARNGFGTQLFDIDYQSIIWDMMEQYENSNNQSM